MPYYFQVKGSTNLNKIAVVNSQNNANSFRNDNNWYELTEEEYHGLFKKETITEEATKKEVKKPTRKTGV